MGKKGRFIVIDGTNGSGKATQTNIVVGLLRKRGLQVEMMDFPQYGEKSAGLVEEYLNGKYGETNQVGPYKASIFQTYFMSVIKKTKDLLMVFRKLLIKFSNTN